ncbi:SAM-dependent methyltransferase [Hydrogenophaga luteola]|uniref:SAM-dependent methyltransferase n=1 Tax=Hydrogenophaga luteola TaxID=1591122 RepID=A0ABV7W7R2_9BURK
MSAPAQSKGTLFLVPTPLDFGCSPQDPAPLELLLPDETLEVAARLVHWVAENAKSARAFLKRVDAARGLATPVQNLQIAELPRLVHKKGDHAPASTADTQARALLGPALQGHDMGLVSEAGMPAIADPGSSVVRAAHALGIDVRPLTGPVSLMLALASSGLNGQSFSFVGYVPQDPAERGRRLRELESIALKSGQTQILIETPYRNAALLQALLQTLHPHTRLAVSSGLGLPQQRTRSALLSEWKSGALAGQLPLDLPAVFLLGR